MEIWLTSDTHYHHKNLIRGTTNWSEREKDCRDFNTIEEHDDLIVNNINSLVMPNDILYHLGDFAMGGRERIKEFRERLNVKNLHLITGNHDNIKSEDEKLFNSVNQFLIKKIHGRKFTMFHYALRTWASMAKGGLHCYGHSHSNMEYSPYGKSMDIGVDNALKIFGAYEPFNVDIVIDILDTREILTVDHH